VVRERHLPAAEAALRAAKAAEYAAAQRQRVEELAALDAAHLGLAKRLDELALETERTMAPLLAELRAKLAEANALDRSLHPPDRAAEYERMFNGPPSRGNAWANVLEPLVGAADRVRCSRPAAAPPSPPAPPPPRKALDALPVEDLREKSGPLRADQRR